MAADGAIDPTANLQKIRELLFGEQVQDLSQQLNGVEARLAERLQSFETDFLARLAQAREDMSQQLDALGAQLTTESGERIAADNQTNDQLGQARQSLGEQLAQRFDEAAAGRDALSLRLDQAVSELRAALTGEISSVRNDMTARSILADLLSEVSRGLAQPAVAETAETKADEPKAKKSAKKG